ncbi:hypothetical protein EDB87DRAFT_1581816 [Lactarius vividus]|nr:hypothetical protein EDB87DRAFT_1581816 [Lactarius vividus]
MAPKGHQEPVIYSPLCDKFNARVPLSYTFDPASVGKDPDEELPPHPYRYEVDNLSRTAHMFQSKTSTFFIQLEETFLTWIVANVLDYIRQGLEACPHPLLPPPPILDVAYQDLCFLHEHRIAHCAYGDPNGAMMDIGHSSSAGFDRTRLPVRYYRANFSYAQELPRESDPRSVNFCCDVRDCGAMFQTLDEEVPKIGGKLRPLVVALKGGEYGAEDDRKLLEALCKGIDASTYDAPLQSP